MNLLVYKSFVYLKNMFISIKDLFKRKITEVTLIGLLIKSDNVYLICFSVYNFFMCAN